MNRALVFGASGYVGTHLVPCLAARGTRPDGAGGGLLYWHTLPPAHVAIDRGLAQAIAERAQRRATASVPAPVREP